MSFGPFHRRLATLLAHARATTWKHPDAVLQMEIARQNRTLNRSFGGRPIEVWEAQFLAGKGRMPTASRLDLHLSLRCRRRVDNAHSIDFEGRNYKISATLRRSVTVVSHPNRQFWVVELPPKAIWPSILGHFTL